ncbi:hypothetical protein NDU88_004743 [Pleurodeles waltl]|uniref:Uncharacterized protein n=1 Tax=Pleurodeles waltl TaxID=8319 RepID=A0AAV7TA04_PLEWA|nr:hypothetical protein NDU88_004743 [Pleurodeles waltl]
MKRERSAGRTPDSNSCLSPKDLSNIRVQWKAHQAPSDPDSVTGQPRIRGPKCASRTRAVTKGRPGSAVSGVEAKAEGETRSKGQDGNWGSRSSKGGDRRGGEVLRESATNL